MTQEIKHTPGPWKQSIGTEETTIVIDMGFPSIPFKHVCRVYGSNREANAQLIAAAPDLLEALEAIMDGFDGEEFRYIYSDISKAVAAISKARGQS